MGFRPERTIYVLNFDDYPELKGLEVRIQSCTIAELNKMLKAGDTATDSDYDVLTEMFVSKLVSWNIENDDGSPVPITAEGVEAQEPGLITAIIMSWQKAMVAIADPLRKISSNGRSLEEASLGLGTSSVSQPS